MGHNHGPDILWSTESINFTTLAGNTSVASAGSGHQSDFRMTRMEVFIALSGWTTNLAVGPIGLYLKPVAVSTAQAEALIEQDGPLEEEDTQEVANAQEMRVWPVCQLAAISSDGIAYIPNRGMPIIIKPNFTFKGSDSDPGGWNWFAINESGSAFGSETKNITINAKIFGKFTN